MRAFVVFACDMRQGCRQVFGGQLAEHLDHLLVAEMIRDDVQIPGPAQVEPVEVDELAVTAVRGRGRGPRCQAYKTRAEPN